MKMLSFRFGFVAVCFFLAARMALAGTLEGTVRNGTTGKAAAGVDVILIQLQGGMQPVATTKADAGGHYRFDRPELSGAPMLVRVPYRGVNYHEPVLPGKTTADVQVFEPTQKADAFRVTTRAIVLQPSGDRLLVGEEYAVENRTQPPVAFFKQDGTFDFNLPPDGRLGQVSAWSASGMPVVQGTIDKGKNRDAIAFAFKPGENGVRLSYQLPYPGNQTTLHTASPYAAQRVLVVAVPSVQVTGAGFAPAGTEQGFSIYARDSVPANTAIDISVSGTAPPPSDNGGAAGGDASQDPSVNSRSQAPGEAATALPARLDSLKWILVAGFGALFALGAVWLWRRPQFAGAAPAAGGVANTPVRKASQAMADVEREARGSLEELKEQIFRLELRRQAGTISEDDYVRQREQIEKTLRDLVRG
ncbi:MAG: hypothetical protein WBC04_11595 [Candidatus Acidiferrales bacterium]